MKISCERCSAQYDLDENRIPPSGMTMKCPACLHQFTVRRGGSAAPTVPTMPKPPAPAPPPTPKSPPKREIELSSFHEDEGPTPLPSAAPGLIAPDPDEIDLPAPKDVSAPELPAPKAPSRPPAIPPPRPPAVPAARRARSRDGSNDSVDSDRSRPRADSDLAAERAGAGRDRFAGARRRVAPRHHRFCRRRSRARPRRPRPVAVEPEDEADLLAPKSRAPQVGISLDAPEPDDFAPATGTLGDEAGPPALELENIDVVAPKVDTPELPAPKSEITDVAPKQETVDVAYKRVSPAPARSEPAPAAARPAAAQPVAKPAPVADEDEGEDEDKPKRRWGRTLAAVVGVLLLLGGVGVALGTFTGFGRELLGRRPSAQVEQQLMSARKQMADDTLGSYRKAALGLQSLVEQDAKMTEAALLAVQAHLGAARLGLPSELKEADAMMGKVTDDKAPELPDYQKAKALRSTVIGNFGDARSKLGAVLQKAPADAAALVYLGWTELAAGDPAAADKAFARALAAEATRAAALYGDGVAKERLGDAAAAHELYARTLSRSPMHFGAAVGAARTGQKATEAQAAVQELIDKRATSVGPKELADAWATVGILAAKKGRRDEAEDRLKRALALDPDHAAARVALARVQCDLRHCADAVEPLQEARGRAAEEPRRAAGAGARARPDQRRGDGGDDAGAGARGGAEVAAGALRAGARASGAGQARSRAGAAEAQGRGRRRSQAILRLRRRVEHVRRARPVRRRRRRAAGGADAGRR